MNPEPLVRAIVAAMMLMEECGPDEIDPDTAVRGLENMGYEILQLSGDDRGEFLELIERMAQSSDSHTAEFIRAIPFSIGMVDDLPPESSGEAD
jgi:hypothetical protein